jgi:hypothetical protein
MFFYRSAEEQLLKLRKYEYQMFLDNKLPPPFSSARAQAARYRTVHRLLLKGSSREISIVEITFFDYFTSNFTFILFYHLIS